MANMPMSKMSPRKAMAQGDKPVERKNGGKVAMGKSKMVKDTDRDGMKKGGRVKGKC